MEAADREGGDGGAGEAELAMEVGVAMAIRWR